jgi:hypothetical protein
VIKEQQTIIGRKSVSEIENRAMKAEENKSKPVTPKRKNSKDQ